MNSSGNQRYRETEQRIIAVFLELLNHREPEKITVSQICAACGINRSSFYLHFTDVYALMVRIDRLMSEHLAQIFAAGGEDWNIGSRFISFFAFIGEHRDFYRVYLERCRESNLFNIVLSDRNMRDIQLLAERMGFIPENELSYHQAFFKAGLASMLREWIDRGCQESPEEMGMILAREYAPDRGQFV